ncbi:interaptin-like isoform X1 [Xiphophorus hellerii]|uniref:interaptin-like isoform X1 n=1 Tax=Xiphophorus hellerii TaxID=8084 RepID=UPI0013B3C4BA|nr:interaptin-like isoform X1 [Xiphophorus hellerii]
MPKQKNKGKSKKPTSSFTQMDSSYKEKLENAGLTLKQKEDELSSVKVRLTEMETWYKGRLGEAEAALKQNEDELNSTRSSFTQMDSFYKERQEDAGLTLKQKEDELSSVKVRLTEMETWYKGRLGEAEAALKQNEDELNSTRSSFTQMDSFYKEKLEEAGLILKQKEDELSSVKVRLTEMETWYKGRLGEAEAALKQKDNELNSVKQRLTGMEKKMTSRLTVSSWTEDKTMTVQSANKGAAGIETLYRFKPYDTSVAEIEIFYKRKLDEVSAALKRKDKELKSFKDRLAAQLTVSRENTTSYKMEASLKEQLHKATVAQKQKDRELKSIKDRLASMSYLFKSGDTESMNNPASKTRLTEMYDNLKLLQWPKVKDQLKSRNIQSKVVEGLIQETFWTAAGEANKRKQQIEEAFGLSEYSSGLTAQKVKEYRQLTVQNLQMALFHTNKEELLKPGFPELGGPYSEEVKENLRPLISECYWLSCLMALNNPPLQPDWKNLVPSMDPWDIFPRNITSATVM